MHHSSCHPGLVPVPPFCRLQVLLLFLVVLAAQLPLLPPASGYYPQPFLGPPSFYMSSPCIILVCYDFRTDWFPQLRFPQLFFHSRNYCCLVVADDLYRLRRLLSRSV